MLALTVTNCHLQDLKAKAGAKRLGGNTKMLERQLLRLLSLEKLLKLIQNGKYEYQKEGK